MRRRTFLTASAATIAAPVIAKAQDNRVLKFVPQSDVTVLDPIWTTAYVTRNHGYMIFDTLFGTDGSFKPSPQMAAGMTAENGARLVKITLREGLKFHDGTPVLARDCVASIERWSKRDTFGATLMAATDELTAADDKTIQFRLKRPFPLLPDALGKSPTSFPAMMPERLAKTDAFTQVTEMVGSGPYKFPTGPPVRKSPISIGSSGTSSRTPAPLSARCKRVRSTGGKTPATTCSPPCETPLALRP